MKKSINLFAVLVTLLLTNINSFSKVILDDTTKTYTMPLLAKTPQGEVVLSWVEKDAQGISSFCMAFSKDGGKTFLEKKLH